MAWAAVSPIKVLLHGANPNEAHYQSAVWERQQLKELLDRNLIIENHPRSKKTDHRDDTEYHMHDILRDLAVEECRKQDGHSGLQHFVQPREKVADHIPADHEVCVQFP